MNRQDATSYCRERLNQYNKPNWRIKVVVPNVTTMFLGMCDPKTKTIYLNAHHIDTHPEIEVRDTINHEVAHALTVGHAHNIAWQAKARELGASPIPCTTYGISPVAVDAIRSGDILEVDYELVKRTVMVPTEVEVREPKYKVHKFVDNCEVCHKQAVETSRKEFRSGNKIKQLITLECGHIRIIDADSQSPFDLIVSNSWKIHVKNCKHDWDTFDIKRCKKCEEFRLLPFQIDGARAVERHNGRFGIFDQQGLGKTVQALAYLKFHPEAFPVLFIVKSKLKLQWMKEIIRWLGEEYFAQIISDGKQGIMPGLKCYITSFDLFKKFNKQKWEQLSVIGFETVVIDEVQAIKNPDSARTIEVRKVCRNVKRIIPLSGTPWKNRGSEFFVVLNMLSPTLFPNYQQFLDNDVDYYWDGAKYKQGGIKNPAKFREKCKDLFIRRERKDVMPELPDITRMRLLCEIEDHARKAYDDEVSDFVKWYNELVINGEEDSAGTEQTAVARIQRMRHIIGLAKIPQTVDSVEDFIDGGGKHLVIGVHHIDVGQLLIAQIKALNIVKVLALVGGASDTENNRIKEEFIASESCVLVASTLSAGEGTDGLQRVCHDMIMHERQWNPMNEEQLEDRLVRMMQKANKINCTYIHADNSTDTHMDGIVERKRHQFHSTMNKGEAIPWHNVNMGKEMIGAIMAGAKK